MINKMGMSVLNGWIISSHLYSEQNLSLYEAQKNDNGLILKCGIKIYSIPISKKADRDRIISRINVIMQNSMELKCEYILNVDEYEIISTEQTIDLIIRQECAIPLQKYVVQHTFTEARLIDMLRSIINALMTAKEKNIYHNSISPTCIYINNEGTYKLTDFGIANYMCELGMCQNIYLPIASENNNNDIFALGIIIYLLLNGNKISLQNSKIVSLKESISYRSKGVLIAAPYFGANKLKEIVYKCISSDVASRINNLDELYEAINSIPKDLENSNEIIDLSIYNPKPVEAIREEIPIKKKKNTVFLIAIPVGIVISILIIIGTVCAVSFITSKKQVVEVPNFEGMEINKAINKAADSKMLLKVKDEYSNDVEINHIIGQDIPKGSIADEDSVVEITISKGPEKIAVPDYAGQPLNAVLASESNLIIQYQEINSDFPLGTIIGQDIAAGELVDPQSTLTLTVSLGKVLKAVPDFSKMKQPKIKKICEELGLNYTIIREPNDKIKRNFCISQSVEPYSVITTDICIEIRISEGAEKKED